MSNKRRIRPKERRLLESDDWLIVEDKSSPLPGAPIPTVTQYSLFSNFQSAIQKAYMVKPQNPSPPSPPTPHLHFSSLPVSTYPSLLRHLSLIDFVRLGSTSRWSHSFFGGDDFWRVLFEEEFGERRKEDLFDFVSKHENKLNVSYMTRYINEYLRECPPKNGKLCVRCRSSYLEHLNNDAACIFHPSEHFVFGGRVSFACCTAASSNGMEKGQRFCVIGNATQLILKVIANYLWKVWINEPDILGALEHFQDVQPRSSDSIWYPSPDYVPRIGELGEYSLLLLFDLTDPQNCWDSLLYLQNTYIQWHDKHGLCLHTNVPILVGISIHNPPRLSPPKELLSAVMETWDCNRLMYISIGDTNSVLRAFNFASNNMIDHLHRGCTISRHLDVLPVGDTLRKFITTSTSATVGIVENFFTKQQ
eukprot:TRINITY_DN11291_c0_g1_i1.p1 TRINITY_DN11291_c0_g1~~TRINITY_DN11291_c0_g1_i1.p1  ORF type:complete len:420 (+),score=93.81 TRINITY_DN11291_c0_g1_i1:25-1284(+)